MLYTFEFNQNDNPLGQQTFINERFNYPEILSEVKEIQIHLTIERCTKMIRDE